MPREDLGATFANKPANGLSLVPMRTPRGHIRRHGNRYEISVPLGRDPITKRYRYVYDSASTEEEAERRRAALIEQITQGRAPQARATVGDLIDRWLSVAELELITTVNYQSYIERVIRPVLGGCSCARSRTASRCSTSSTPSCAGAAGCAGAGRAWWTTGRLARAGAGPAGSRTTSATDATLQPSYSHDPLPDRDLSSLAAS